MVTLSIKGGDLLTVGDAVLAERLQTGGPGQVSLSPERVYELGNYLGTGILYDIPDLSFSMESLDASCAMEAMLLGTTQGALTAHQKLTLSQNIPFDIITEFKRGVNDANSFDVYGSAVLPFLTTESVSYKFGLKDKAAQTVTLKGDTIYYPPGSAFRQHATGTNTANQTVVLTHKVYQNNDDVINGVRYALGVKLSSGKRLTLGTDYTEAAVIVGSGPTYTVTVTILAAVPSTDGIDIVYASDTVANYPQNSHTVPSTTKPAAIRGRDIQVFVGGTTLGNRWTSVQSVQADWKVTLDRDYEFGNTQLVAQDFFVPEVSGNIVVKPRNYADLFAKLKTIDGLSTLTEVAGALKTNPVQVLFVLHSPVDGSVLKTIEIPDAILTLPGFAGQVQQKLQFTIPFDSQAGVLNVYNQGM